MNKKLLVLIMMASIIVVSAVIVLHHNTNMVMTPSEKATTTTSRPVVPSGSVNSPASSTSYVPVPIDRSQLLSGEFTEDKSPDGEFVSHTFTNEQSDSGVYLTTNTGTVLTDTYCGYFRAWFPDSKKIKVFVPYTCGKDVSENEFFELHIDGTIRR